METLLVPLDGSTFGEHALPAAIAIARRAGMGLALTHVHQVAVPPAMRLGELGPVPDLDLLVRDQEVAYLEDVARRLAAVCDAPVTLALLDAPITPALCRYAQELDAALIVISSHGRGGMARAWLGSVTDRLLRQAPTPILVVHPRVEHAELTREPPLEHILIPLDGSPLAEQAIAPAVALGQLTGARYSLLRVVEPIMRGFFIDGIEPALDLEAQEQAWHHATAYLDAVAQPLRSQGLIVSTETPIGKPSTEILEWADGHCVDLIAMATHGRGGVSRLLVGSVADKVFRGSPVPLLVCRPQGDGSA